MSRGRSIYGTAWRNFIQSFLPKQTKGNLMGKDHLGTSYFEIPADPRGGKRRPARWFQAQDREAFDQELPAEWESWLRGRRTDPPSQEEINMNSAIAETKKIKAAELEISNPSNTPPQPKETSTAAGGSKDFPKFEEYEVFPGREKPKR